MDAVYPKLYAGKVTIVTKGRQAFYKAGGLFQGHAGEPDEQGRHRAKISVTAGAAIGETQAETLLVEVNRALTADSIVPLASTRALPRVGADVKNAAGSCSDFEGFLWTIC